MKKFFVVFALFAAFFQIEAAAPKNQKKGQSQQEKPKLVVAKSYSFSEELIDLPIRPFVVQKINDADLLDADPQVLGFYENAVNAEKWPNVQQNPLKAMKAWLEVSKITQKNPFLNIANGRLWEWKKSIELFNKHQENIEKLKILLATSILPLSQKKSIMLKHLNEFGVTFGTQEIFELAAGNQELTNELKESDFQVKFKEIKQKRCDRDSGKDCYECGKDYASADYEKIILFAKACKLNFQPGCDEVNKIKAAQEAEKARIAAEEKRKAEEFATKTYNFKDEPVNLIKPFVLGKISEQDILDADPQVLKKFEAVIVKEKEKDTYKTPGAITVMWDDVAKITEKNPFAAIAKKRAAEWRACAEKMYKYEKDLNLVKKALREDSGVSNEQKIIFVIKHLNEYGVIFGTSEIVNGTIILYNYNNEISNNEAVKAKIKETKKHRCDLNSADDCYTFAINYAANSEEKTAYLKKACYLGRKQACDNTTSNSK